MRIDPAKLDEVLHPTIDPRRPAAIAKGLPASPGAAIGRIVFTATARRWVQRGETRDLSGPTPRPRHPRHEGGVGHPDRARRMTSHSAVVARGMASAASPVPSLRVDAAKKTAAFVGGGQERKLRRATP